MKPTLSASSTSFHSFKYSFIFRMKVNSLGKIKINSWRIVDTTSERLRAEKAPRREILGFRAKSHRRQKGALSSHSGILVGAVDVTRWPLLQNAEVTLTQHYDGFEWKQVSLTSSVLNPVLLRNSRPNEHIYLTGPVRYPAGTFTAKI